MNFIIRKMKKEDIKQVRDVATKSWHSTYDGIIPHEIQENFLKVAYSDQMMERKLHKSFIFVAEVENKIIGFANFTLVNEKRQSELSAIYLYPIYQGKGIGTELLQKGINELENIKEIYVDVERENSIGKSFYKAKGFQVIKEYDDKFNGHIFKTIRMSLTN